MVSIFYCNEKNKRKKRQTRIYMRKYVCKVVRTPIMGFSVPQKIAWIRAVLSLDRDAYSKH